MTRNVKARFYVFRQIAKNIRQKERFIRQN